MTTAKISYYGANESSNKSTLKANQIGNMFRDHQNWTRDRELRDHQIGESKHLKLQRLKINAGHMPVPLRRNTRHQWLNLLIFVNAESI